MLLLTEFLLRLTFGLAGAMVLVPPRQVTSGYFRNHLYVTMGLALLAALLCSYAGAAPREAFWPAALAAGASYVGSVFWLYEKPAAGKAALIAVSGLALWGSLAVLGERASVWRDVHATTSGALLGIVMASMLLGHWYLNAPGMPIAPLQRLLIAATIAVVMHGTLCAAGLSMELSSRSVPTHFWMLLALRWLFGLAGVVILIWMAWQTLKIPNTQSATGILYVAVIGTFVGETMSLLLSAESVYPL
jgi:hypothetical protein